MGFIEYTKLDIQLPCRLQLSLSIRYSSIKFCVSGYYVTGGEEEFNLLDVFDVVRPKMI